MQLKRWVLRDSLISEGESHILGCLGQDKMLLGSFASLDS